MLFTTPSQKGPSIFMHVVRLFFTCFLLPISWQATEAGASILTDNACKCKRDSGCYSGLTENYPWCYVSDYCDGRTWDYCDDGSNQYEAQKGIIGELKKQIDGLERTKSELTETSARLKEGNIKLENRNEALGQQNNALESSRNELMEKNTELEKHNEALVQQNKALESSRNKLMEKNTELEKHNEALVQQNKALESSKNVLESSIRELTQQVSDLSESRTKLGEDHTGLIQQYQVLVRNNTECTDKTSHLMELQGDLSEAKNALDREVQYGQVVLFVAFAIMICLVRRCSSKGDAIRSFAAALRYNSDGCSICLYARPLAVVLNPCNHASCAECWNSHEAAIRERGIRDVAISICPICRADVESTTNVEAYGPPYGTF